MWLSAGVTVDASTKLSRASPKKQRSSIKKQNMPSLLRVGSEVSSKKSKTGRLIEPPHGKKRKVRERVYGVIMSSVEGMWEVQWAGGEVEMMPPASLKNEGEPTEETRNLVRLYKAR